MAGILYLMIALLLGTVLCGRCFPDSVWHTDTAYRGETADNPLPAWFIRLPASFFAGTLVLTWAVYLAAYALRYTAAPLTYADVAVMGAAGLFLILYYSAQYKKSRKKPEDRNSNLAGGRNLPTVSVFLFLAPVILLGIVLMWYPFFAKGGDLYTGYSVFSDFSPHLGLIRSFTRGDNFPTQYPFYAGEDIRYHFLFQFLAGNLEHLGLRIDFAFNLPSLFSFVGCIMLLTALAVKITGKRGAGVLCAVLFCFRSSGALFSFLAAVPAGTGILAALKQNTEFIGTTPNESWGLWNLNVYTNQRHLAFGLCGILFLLHLFLPALFDMRKKEEEAAGSADSTAQRPVRAHSSGRKDKKRGIPVRLGGQKSRLHALFLTRQAWLPENGVRPAAAGILLGGLAFFNGACVVAGLAVLFVIAIFSSRRFELLITACITAALALLQSAFFVSGSIVQTQYFFGFIAENKTMFGVCDYLLRLLGILSAVLCVAFLFLDAGGRRLFYAFLAPLILAFTVSLTPDVTVNHKYVMISVMLFDILAAEFLWTLFQNRRLRLKAAAGAITVLLTATGIYDFIIVIRRNGPARSIVYSLTDPLTLWVQENAASDDIFLTSNYSLHPIVLGGGMLYEGWPYYAWSAGYDTSYRDGQVKRMYEAETSDELKDLAVQNRIRYIVVDADNRFSADYELRQDVIEETYEKVYEQGEGDNSLVIFDTRRPRN